MLKEKFHHPAMLVWWKVWLSFQTQFCVHCKWPTYVERMVQVYSYSSFNKNSCRIVFFYVSRVSQDTMTWFACEFAFLDRVVSLGENCSARWTLRQRVGFLNRQHVLFWGQEVGWLCDVSGKQGRKKSVLPQLTGVGLPESLETRAAPHQSGQEESEQVFDLVLT